MVASLVAQLVETLPAMWETQLVPGLGRSPGEGNVNPLQYSCLENFMDRGAWKATIHGVAESQTQHFHFNTSLFELIIPNNTHTHHTDTPLLRCDPMQSNKWSVENGRKIYILSRKTCIFHHLFERNC